MTNEEKITKVQTLLGNDEEATDALVAVYLDDAKEAILNRRFPLKNSNTSCKFSRKPMRSRGISTPPFDADLYMVPVAAGTVTTLARVEMGSAVGANVVVSHVDSSFVFVVDFVAAN